MSDEKTVTTGKQNIFVPEGAEFTPTTARVNGNTVAFEDIAAEVTEGWNTIELCGTIELKEDGE